MKSTEFSFGARLGRAKTLIDYINGFAVYAPPQAIDSIENFTAFVQVLSEENNLLTQKAEQYNVAVNKRQTAFFGKENSAISILSSLRSAVIAQYGKSSIQVKDLERVIKKIRGAKKSTAVAVDPNSVSNGKIAAPKKTGISQRSYDAVAERFVELVETLAQFPDYSSSNANLLLATLQAQSENLLTLNSETMVAYAAQTVNRSQRLIQFEELKERTERMKNYIKAHYGILSNENTLVRKLSF